MRYRLRTLLIVVTVISAALGLLVSEYRRVVQQRQVLDGIDDLGGGVGKLYSLSILNPRTILRSLFGNEGYASEHLVYFDSQANTQLQDEDDLRLLNDLEHVTQLTLRGPFFTDKSLRQIAPLRELKRLRLEDTQVTAAGFKELQFPSQLEYLLLTGATIDDSTLSCLTGFPNLKRLDLIQTNLTGSGLARLKTLRHLDHVCLANNGLSNASMRDIGQIESLIQIEITEDRIDDSGIALLGSLNELFRLELYCSKITGKGLATLAQMPNLEVLLVLPNAVDTDTVSSVNAMKRLRAFYVRQGLSDEEFFELKNSLPQGLVSEIDESNAIIR
jgi:hypothetical protein